MNHQTLIDNTAKLINDIVNDLADQLAREDCDVNVTAFVNIVRVKKTTTQLRFDI